ncbi:hypothetical protein [Cryptosporangium sp. NPDC048952]|uniref:hypothetical protein n=1 Tax=Cryptosporangium sp. NPDC048952 TaxID=3363961 RepID=UPI0037236D51
MPDDVVDALAQFVARIDVFDPEAPVHTELEVDGRKLTLREPVARALVEALRAYGDPRDNGSCDHCGSRRMDTSFHCNDCGRFSGLFGDLIAQRAAEYTEPDALPTQRALPAESEESSWTSS